MLKMCDFRYEPWPELKWLLDSFLPRFSAAAASVSMEQDEDEVAECDKVRTNIFYLKRGENQSRLDDFSPLRTSAAVSKYRGAENQFPLSKIIISLIAERADKQQ